MKKLMIVVVLAFLPYLTGCTHADSRTKRAAALLNAKTQVTIQEREAAKTPDEKLAVDDAYFKTAGQFTQVLDDTVHNRKPLDTAIEANTPKNK